MEEQKIIVPAKIPGLLEALKNEDAFPDNLRYIMQTHGIGATAISRIYGISRMQVYRYLKGEDLPREPAIYMSVNEWADYLRKSIKAS
ncbi:MULTISPECIES: helix-turn-helix domain-containing protein [Dehalococcoides]|jgi:predicted transcriptional regulator|uniref:Uncharacterized protein n=2 Tax=root TaxID=1 RepID=A0A1S7AUS2_9CHLR|nr:MULTISPECIES: helix-turn-helix transcriptional regulator [Dehalococcoides]AQU06045.1 hypothetical protein B1777_04965 [Dehalococcoides mccartyi]AQU07488.1 hypothetical protein B1778_04770 [Dehalococcoides mccartyi]AQX73359.1 hypothetical protein B1775_04190 [Dehalococcoides mccartyi]PKH47770.1 hypothetical protein CVH13_00247 [Dehalococcoides mccartyi]